MRWHDLGGLVAVAAAVVTWDVIARAAGLVTVTGAVRRAARHHPVAFGAVVGALLGHLAS